MSVNPVAPGQVHAAAPEDPANIQEMGQSGHDDYEEVENYEVTTSRCSRLGDWLKKRICCYNMRKNIHISPKPTKTSPPPARRNRASPKKKTPSPKRKKPCCMESNPSTPYLTRKNSRSSEPSVDSPVLPPPKVVVKNPEGEIIDGTDFPGRTPPPPSSPSRPGPSSASASVSVPGLEPAPAPAPAAKELQDSFEERISAERSSNSDVSQH